MSEHHSEFYSVAQAAEALHITERAVRHRIKAGTIEAHKLGPGTAAYVITRAEVERVKAGVERLAQPNKESA